MHWLVCTFIVCKHHEDRFSRIEAHLYYSTCIYAKAIGQNVHEHTHVHTNNNSNDYLLLSWLYSKTCVKWQLSKRPKNDFQDQLLLNVGQKYCRMLQGEHSAILSTFIKLPFVIKIFVLSVFEWSFYTGFTVYS